MARQSRLVLAGQPHLLMQSGIGATPVFVDAADRRSYLESIFECSRSGGVTVHAYALADRQVQLLATPGRADDLGRFMQRVGRRYVATFNLRHQREGALWAGRFRTIPLDPERHLLEAMVLVEQLPVREALAERALDWPWSSARHHAGQRSDPLIQEHRMYWRLGNTPFEREAEYAALLDSPLPEQTTERLLVALASGWPLGTDEYIRAFEKIEGKPLKPNARGRPRRS